MDGGTVGDSFGEAAPEIGLNEASNIAVGRALGFADSGDREVARNCVPLAVAAAERNLDDRRLEPRGEINVFRLLPRSGLHDTSIGIRFAVLKAGMPHYC